MSQILVQRKKYEPKFMVSTMKNDLTGMFFILLIFVTIKFLPFSIKLRLVVAGAIFLIGFVFIIVDGLSLLLRARKFKTTMKNVSYYDPRMNEFIDVSTVKNNTAIKKDGAILAFLRVIPRDLNIMSPDEQRAVIDSYIQFLTALESDIQIVSRSVPIDIETWLYNMQRKIGSRTNDPLIEYNLERFEDFKKWVNTIIEEGSIRNRVFYIVISHKPMQKFTNVKSAISSFFQEMTGSGSSIDKANLPVMQQALKEINDKVVIYTEILGRMGVGIERLNNNQILSMYSGYSSDIEGIDTNYITPFMWPKEVDKNE